LGSRHFDHLEQYGEDFLRYIESSDPLFGPDNQQRCFRKCVRDYLVHEAVGPVWEKHGFEPSKWDKTAWADLAELLEQDNAAWQACDDLETTGPAFGASVVAKYADSLAALQAQLFNNVTVPPKIASTIRHAVEMIYTKNWFLPHEKSGVVIAGFGEDDAFPQLVQYEVASVVNERLRYAKVDECSITFDNDAEVVPVAQRQMIDLFYSGMFPSIHAGIVEIFGSTVRNLLKLGNDEEGDKEINRLQQAFKEQVDGHIRSEYTQPLIDAVAALPLYDLSSLAESLISLTAFRARMSASEEETVGGHIDVAVLSKGDGFVWVRKKDFVSRAREA
jgi:hypothetical protein